MSASQGPDDPGKSVRAPVVPHTAQELRALFVAPLRFLQVVLSDHGRLAHTISTGSNMVLLVGALLYASVLFALPFGAVLGLERFWRIAVLLVGSLAICFPSLQVFSAYVGCRIDTRQNLALGLVITCVAALFTFGFFPILWFLQATMLEDATITPYGLSLALIAFSLLAGILHLYRCLARFVGLVSAYTLLMLFWNVLFFFITYRMARVLELL